MKFVLHQRTNKHIQHAMNIFTKQKHTDIQEAEQQQDEGVLITF